MPDYQCWPLWHHGDGMTGNIDPRSLGLSVELQVQLEHWADVYESHLDWSDPASTRLTEQEEKAFEFEGRRLCVALAQELGIRFSVFYFDRKSAACVPASELFLGWESNPPAGPALPHRDRLI